MFGEGGAVGHEAYAADDEQDAEPAGEGDVFVLPEVGEERDDSGIAGALAELRRVLAPGGRVLLSVPTGAEEDHGWFVQLPVAMWRELFADAGFEVAEDETYELVAEGWRSSRNEAAGLRYGERGPAASAVYCVELRALEQPAVGAAAAGAGAEDP